MAEQIPPGWYTDPSNQSLVRWWDGRQWTQHVQQVAPPPPAPAGVADQTSAMPRTDHVGWQQAVNVSQRLDRPWWQRKRVLLPAGLLVLVGIASAFVDDPEPTTEVVASEVSGADEPAFLADVDAADTDLDGTAASVESLSSTSATTSTTGETLTPTSSRSASDATTTAAAAARISTSTTMPPATEPPSTAAPTTAAPTTAAPTTAAPTTAAPTTAAPTTPAPTTAAEDFVHPGAFCSPPGATGTSKTGKPMVCSETDKDGVPYGEGRARWRSP